MATSTTMVQETKRYLYAGRAEPVATLNGSHNNSTTTFTFNVAQPAVQVGSYLSVNLEIVLVTAVPTTTTATVIRAQLGSAAGTHASGDVVYVNSRFTDFAILEAINAEIDALSSPTNGLFQAVTAELTYNASAAGYNITSATAINEILEVSYKDSGAGLYWPPISDYRLRRAAETDDFASGFALTIYAGAQPGNQLRVTYAAPFVRFTALAQDAQTTAKLPATANDVPCLGAALRLQAVREGQANFNEAQPGSRRGDETPPGSQLRGATGPQALYLRRIGEERTRLRQAWPRMRRV